MPLVASADDFTWNGGNNTWPSLNWTNVTTSANPVAGPTTGGNTATISAGTVTFARNDTFGSDATTASPTITLGADATLNSGGFFNTIWNLNLAGGTLLSDGGANASFPAFQLAGTLSVTGSQASTIGVAATPRNVNNAINVGGNGNAVLTLDVSDVTGDAAADLTIAAVLKNLGNGAVGNVTKTGAGTAVLSANNIYTGTTTITTGTLRVGAGGTSGTLGTGAVVNNATLIFDRSDAPTAANAISGTGSLQKLGAGTLTLSGASTYSGGTTVSTGTLALSGGSNRLSTTGVITVANGATLDLGGNPQTTSGVVTLAGGSTLRNGVLTSTSGTLGGNNFFAGTLTAANGGGLSTNQRLLIAAGGTGSLTLTGAGSFAFGGDAGNNMNYVGVGGGNASLSVTGGMTVNFTNVAGGNGYLNVGSNSNASVGTLTVNGGTVNVGTWLKLGGNFNAATGTNATGSLSIQNGTVAIGGGSQTTAVGGAANGVLQMNGANGDATTTSNTSVTLGTGGLLRVRQIQPGFGTKTITFNGGTLRAAAASTTFLNATAGLAVNVGNGGGTLDTNGFDITVSAPFSATGSGGLTKTGAGTLTLSGTNAFTGATTVSQGTLAVTGAFTSSAVTVTNGGTAVATGTMGATTIAAGGTLTGTGTAGATTVTSGGTISPGVAGAGTLSLGSLTFGAAPGDTAAVAIGLAANVPASSISVAGDVVANGGAGSVVFPFGTDLALIPGGTYPLVTYGGTQLADVTAFAATGTVGARQGVSIGNGTGSIDLAVSNAWPIWKGDAGSGWSSADNWVLNTTSAPTSFIADDTVFFSDGADTGSVEITQSVNPTITTFNAATLPYTLTSSGGFGITTGSVLKSGAATVTISTPNAYTGGTTLSAGTLRAGSDTAFGTGPVTVSAGGTTLGASADANLANAVSLGQDITIDTSFHALGLGGVISGPGGIAKTGDGTLTLSAANTFSGANSVTAGTLALSGSGTLGGGTAALSLAGGRLELGGTSQTAGALTISAPAATGETLTAGTLTATSYAVSNTTGNVEIAAGLAGSGSLVKTGAGTLTLTGVSSFSGGTTISAGALAFAGGTNRLSTTGPITVSGGATLDLGGGSQTTSGTVTLTGGTLAGGTLTLTSGGSYSPNGTITLATGGTFRFDSSGQRLLLMTRNLTMDGSAGDTMRFGGDASGTANYVGVDGQNGTLTLNGGTLAFVIAAGQTNAGGGWLRIGSNSGASGTVTVNSGLLDVGHSASLAGRFDNGAVATTSSGTLTISGGQVVVGSGTLSTTAGGANGYLYLSNDAAGSTGSAIVNLNGGSLTAKRIVPGTGGGTKALNLGGGTLRAGGSDSNFLAAATGFTASIGDGGGTIDTNGFDIAIAAPLAAGGSGGLTKLGTGSLTLSAANSFTGATTISAGTLVAANAAALGTTGTVAIGATGALGIADGVSFSRPLSIATAGRVRLGDGSTVALPDAAALAAVESTSPETLGTLARILFGSGVTQPTALSTAWAPDPGEYFSDILTLEGTGADNTFVLSLEYDPAAPDLSLLNIGTRPGTTGPFTPLGTSFVGSVAWNGSFTTPGQYGVDTTSGTVWAVTNHNSDFTVMAVPEPSLATAAVAAQAAAAGLAARRRRMIE
jgi:autotransporter-associated beta strand protein